MKILEQINRLERRSALLAEIEQELKLIQQSLLVSNMYKKPSDDDYSVAVAVNGSQLDEMLNKIKETNT